MVASAKPAVPGKVVRIRQSPIGELQRTHTEELVIGLCGPIGSGHREVAAELKRQLEDRYAYKAEIIKLRGRFERG